MKTLAALLLALSAPFIVLGDSGRERVLVFYGDSVTRGADDKPFPPDNVCAWAGSASCWSPGTSADVLDSVQVDAWCDEPGLVACTGGPGVMFAKLFAKQLGIDAIINSGLGGMTAVGASTSPFLPQYQYESQLQKLGAIQWIMMSLHTNGGEPAIEQRNAIQLMVDHYRAQTNTHVFFWRSPASVGKVKQGGALETALFDGGPDSIRDLFLGTEAGEYGNVANVHYTEEPYRYFETEPRPEHLFAFGNETGGPASTYIHPNGEGYAVLGWVQCEWVAELIDHSPRIDPNNALGKTPQKAAPIDWSLPADPADYRCERRPDPPTIQFDSSDGTSITLTVTKGSDPDGDPTSAYVWLVPDGKSPGDVFEADLLQQLNTALEPNATTCINENCEADAADPVGRDSDLACNQNADNFCRNIPDRWRVSGSTTIHGLTPGTTYTAAAYTWDGKVPSDFTTLTVSTQ